MYNNINSTATLPVVHLFFSYQYQLIKQ